jgi:predicted GIY-YIG superfamily endonuclease
LSDSGSDSDSHSDSDCESDPGSDGCSRCGRSNHSSDACYAKTHANGTVLSNRREKSNKAPASAASQSNTNKNAGVYVLQLEQGHFYVGESKNIKRRVARHKEGKGAAWTKKYKVVCEVAPETKRMESLESWERCETLHLIRKHGIHKVRGWKYTQVELTEATRCEAFKDVCTINSLCVGCGGDGHMVQYSVCGNKPLAPWAKKVVTKTILDKQKQVRSASFVSETSRKRKGASGSTNRTSQQSRSKARSYTQSGSAAASSSSYKRRRWG